MSKCTAVGQPPAAVDMAVACPVVVGSPPLAAGMQHPARIEARPGAAAQTPGRNLAVCSTPGLARLPTVVAAADPAFPANPRPLWSARKAQEHLGSTLAAGQRDSLGVGVAAQVVRWWPLVPESLESRLDPAHTRAPKAGDVAFGR